MIERNHHLSSRSSYHALVGDQPDQQAASAGRIRSEQASTQPMPVLRPKLPSAVQLAPYLRAIDERRSYSNYGPLSTRLETELSRHIGCPENTVLTVASGTAGLTAALLALDLPEDSLCLMPSWTFAATPHAALAAGMRPWFHDVDRRTWALNAQAVSETLAHGSCPAKAVIVVSPFGAPLDITSWQNFQRETGVAVIVDAAAGFDTVRSSSVISVVSLHATKILAAGEGGFAVAPASQMRDRMMACCNFGFAGSRSAQRRAINAKLSEYHAAVALASLDSWPATRLRHLQISEWYRQAIGRLPGISLQPGYGEGWVTGATNVVLDSGSAENIARAMLHDGIETRMWWSQGCHVQPAFADCGRGELPVTENLAARVLGLPHFPEMTKDDVEAVAAALGKARKERTRRAC